MTKGLTVCLICYNEEYWLPKTLPDMIKYSDKIVIVDGSPFGPSNDKTEEIIMSNIRPADIYIRGMFGSERTTNNWNIVMRNECLKHIDTSHMIVVDADEAYFPGDWKKLRDYVNKGIVAVRHPYVHFYIDTSHVLKGDIWDGLYHHFNVYRPDLIYRRLGSFLEDKNGKRIISYAGSIIDNSIRIFHYNRVSPPEVYRLKEAKFKKRADGGNMSDKDYDIWLKNWKDTRSLDNKSVFPWKGLHPLEGKL